MTNPTDANGRQRTPTDAVRPLRETIQEYLTEHYDYFREQNDHPGLSMHTETYTDISDWFDALADAAIAAMVTALLSETAVEAGGHRLSRGALFPDAYRTDPEYKRRSDDLAQAVIEAALCRIGAMETGGER